MLSIVSLLLLLRVGAAFNPEAHPNEQHAFSSFLLSGAHATPFYHERTIPRLFSHVAASENIAKDGGTSILPVDAGLDDSLSPQHPRSLLQQQGPPSNSSQRGPSDGFSSILRGNCSASVCSVCFVPFFAPTRACSICLPDLYGPECDAPCNAMTSCNARGRCDFKGRCACLNGFDPASNCSTALPPLQPMNANISAQIFSDRAIIRWNENFSMPLRRPLIGYRLDVLAAANAQDRLASIVIPPHFLIAHVSNLRPGALYQVSLTLRYVDGNGPSANVTLRAGTVPPFRLNVTVTPSAPRDLAITWTVPPNAVADQLIGVRIVISAPSGRVNLSSPRIEGSLAVSQVLQVAPGDVVNFEIAAENAFGVGPFANVTARVLDRPLSAINVSIVADYSSNTIFARWVSIANASTADPSFIVDWSFSQSFAALLSTSNTSSTSSMLTPPTFGARYFVRVTACSAIGCAQPGVASIVFGEMFNAAILQTNSLSPLRSNVIFISFQGLRLRPQPDQIILSANVSSADAGPFAVAVNVTSGPVSESGLSVFVAAVSIRAIKDKIVSDVRVALAIAISNMSDVVFVPFFPPRQIQIAAVLPAASSPLSGGAVASITAMGFPASVSGDAVVLRFGQLTVNLTGLTAVDGGRYVVSFRVPSAQNAGVVRVTLGVRRDESYEGEAHFAYFDTPFVSRVIPSSAPITGGVLCDIIISNVAASAAGSPVSPSFGSVEASSFSDGVLLLSWRSPRLNRSSAAVALNVTLRFASYFASFVFNFVDIADPSISSILPSQVSSAGGAVVTITGRSFTYISPSPTAVVFASGPVQFTSTSVFSFDSSSIVVTAVTAPLAAGIYNLTLSIGSESARIPLRVFDSQLQAILQVVPSLLPVLGRPAAVALLSGFPNTSISATIALLNSTSRDPNSCDIVHNCSLNGQSCDPPIPTATAASFDLKLAAAVADLSSRGQRGQSLVIFRIPSFADRPRSFLLAPGVGAVSFATRAGSSASSLVFLSGIPPSSSRIFAIAPSAASAYGGANVIITVESLLSAATPAVVIVRFGDVAAVVSSIIASSENSTSLAVVVPSLCVAPLTCGGAVNVSVFHTSLPHEVAQARFVYTDPLPLAVSSIVPDVAYTFFSAAVDIFLTNAPSSSPRPHVNASLVASDNSTLSVQVIAYSSATTGAVLKLLLPLASSGPSLIFISIGDKSAIARFMFAESPSTPAIIRFRNVTRAAANSNELVSVVVGKIIADANVSNFAVTVNGVDGPSMRILDGSLISSVDSLSLIFATGRQTAGFVEFFIYHRAFKALAAKFTVEFVDTARPVVSFVFPSQVPAGEAASVSVKFANAVNFSDVTVVRMNDSVVLRSLPNSRDSSQLDVSFSETSIIGPIALRMRFASGDAIIAFVSVLSPSAISLLSVSPTSDSVDGGAAGRLFLRNIPSATRLTNSVLLHFGADVTVRPLTSSAAAGDVEISFEVPPRLDLQVTTSVAAFVNVSGTVLPFNFTYRVPLPPEVLSIFPSSGSSSGGYNVTLVVAGLPRYSNCRRDISARVGDSAVAPSECSVSFQSGANATRLVLTMPSAAASATNVVVFVTSVPSRVVVAPFVVVDPLAPSVIDIAPSSVRLSGGDLLTLRLRNMPSGVTPSVFLFGIPSRVASTSTFENRVTLTVVIPSLVDSSLSMASYVVIDTATLPFNVSTIDDSAYVIKFVSPSRGAVVGGFRVTVRVENFPAVSSPNNLTLSLTLTDAVIPVASIIRSDSIATELYFVMPAIESQSRVIASFRLAVRGLAKSVNFSIVCDPVTSSAAGEPSKGPSTGGTTVLLTLAYFPVVAAASDAVVAVGGVTLNESALTLVSSSIAKTALTIVMPASTPSLVTVVVMSKAVGQASALSFLYAYEDATEMRITSISSRRGATAGGDLVAVTISNAPATDGSPSVRFNTSAASIATLSDATKSSLTLIITVPPSRSAGDAAVTISVGRVSLSFSFTYFDNAVARVVDFFPSTALATGGSLISVAFLNFAPASNASNLIAVVSDRFQAAIQGVELEGGGRTRVTFRLPTLDVIGNVSLTVFAVATPSMALRVGPILVSVPCSYASYCPSISPSFVPRLARLANVQPSTSCDPSNCIDSSQIPSAEVVSLSSSEAPAAGGVLITAVVANLFVARADEAAVQIGSTFATVLNVSAIDSTRAMVNFRLPAGVPGRYVGTILRNLNDGYPSIFASFSFRFASSLEGAVQPTPLAASLLIGVQTSLVVDIRNCPIISSLSDIIVLSEPSNTSLAVIRIISSSESVTRIVVNIPAPSDAGIFRGLVSLRMSDLAPGRFNLSVVPTPRPSVVTLFPSAAFQLGAVAMSVTIQNVFSTPSPALNFTFGASTTPLSASVSLLQEKVYRFQFTTPAVQSAGVATLSFGVSTPPLAILFPYMSSAAVDFVSPRSASLRGGISINLVVRQLSGAPSSVAVTFGNAVAAIRSSRYDSSSLYITIDVPPSTAAGVVACTVNIPSNSPIPFTFTYTEPPLIATPSSLPTSGGAPLFLLLFIGTQRPALADFTVQIAGTRLSVAAVALVGADVANISTTATPTLPLSDSLVGSIQLGSRVVEFPITTFADPQIVSLSPSRGSLRGGQGITLTGTGFGVISNVRALALSVAGVPVPIQKLLSTAPLTIIFTLPRSGRSGLADVTLAPRDGDPSLVRFRSASSQCLFDVDVPVVRVVTPSRVSALGGSVNVLIDNFVAADDLAVTLVSTGSSVLFRIRFADADAISLSISIPPLSTVSSALLQIASGSSRAFISVEIFDPLLQVSCAPFACVAPASGLSLAELRLFGFPPVLAISDLRVTVGDTLASVQVVNGTSGVVIFAVPAATGPIQGGFLAAAVGVTLSSDSLRAASAVMRYVATPRVESCRMGPDGSSLTITFDAPTNMWPFGSRGGSCAHVFPTDYLRFGAQSSRGCFFADVRRLVVILGFNASVLPSDTLSIVAPSLRAAGNLSDPLPTAQVVVAAPLIVVPFDLVVSSPTVVGVCDSVRLRAFGVSPRPLRFTWNCTNDQGLASFLSTISSSDVIIPPAALATTDFVYSLTAQAVDFLSTSSTQMAFSFLRLSSPAPRLRVLGDGSFRRSDSVFVRVVPEFSECGGQAQFAYSWSLLNPSQPLSGLTLSSVRGPTLLIPPYSLSSGLTYTFVIDVVVGGDTSKSGRVFANISVAYDPLIAFISGGDRTTSLGSPLALSAAQSRDLGERPSVNQNLTFAWSCVTADGSACRDSNGTLLPPPSTPLWVVPSFVLSPALYTFSVSVTKDSRVASDSAAIYIVADVIPTLGIQVSARSASLLSDGTFKINPTDRIVFLASTSIPSIAVNWTVVPALAASVFGFSDDRLSMFIAEAALSPGVSYLVSVSSLAASATIAVVTNTPPFGGTCELSPTNGTALITDFILTCSQWADEDVPLSYRLSYSVANKSSVYSFDGIAETPFALRLPSGVITLSVSVVDSLGAVSSPTLLSARVAPAAVVDLSIIDRQLLLGDARELTRTASTILSDLPSSATRRLLSSEMSVREKILSALNATLFSSSLNPAFARDVLQTLRLLSADPAAIATAPLVRSYRAAIVYLVETLKVSATIADCEALTECTSGLLSAVRSMSAPAADVIATVFDVSDAASSLFLASIKERVVGDSINSTFVNAAFATLRVRVRTALGNAVRQVSGASFAFAASAFSGLDSSASIDIIVTKLATLQSNVTAGAMASEVHAISIFDTSTQAAINPASVSLPLIVSIPLSAEFRSIPSRLLIQRLKCGAFASGDFSTRGCELAEAGGGSALCSCTRAGPYAVVFIVSSANVCGDSLRAATEECDDGDGCSSECKVETNFVCTAAVPSACACSANYFGPACSRYIAPLSVVTSSFGPAASAAQLSAVIGLSFPAGAVTSSVTVEAREYPSSSVFSPQSSLEAVGSVFDFGPSGLTFSAPVRLTLSIGHTNVSQSDVLLASVFYFNGSMWEKVNSSIDSSSKRVSADLWHFSLYTVMVDRSNASTNVVNRILDALREFASFPTVQVAVGVGVGVGGAIIVSFVIFVTVRKRRKGVRYSSKTTPTATPSKASDGHFETHSDQVVS